LLKNYDLPNDKADLQGLKIKGLNVPVHSRHFPFERLLLISTFITPQKERKENLHVFKGVQNYFLK
jgi:hypothetical protein